MSAGKHNLIIDQGADFANQLVIKEDGVAWDITGYLARAQLRKTKTASAIAATFVCTVTDAVAGKVKIELDNATTSGLIPGVHFYDLELYTAGDANVVRLLQGKATITPEITK
jgi:hypothetical protein